VAGGHADDEDAPQHVDPLVAPALHPSNLVPQDVGILMAATSEPDLSRRSTDRKNSAREGGRPLPAIELVAAMCRKPHTTATRAPTTRLAGRAAFSSAHHGGHGIGTSSARVPGPHQQGIRWKPGAVPQL
jgi:hypothetical protein